MTSIVENKKDNKISFSKIDNNLRQLYISYNAIVDFLKQIKFGIYTVILGFYILSEIYNML